MIKILLAMLVLFSSIAGHADLPRFVPVEKDEAGVGEWHEVPFGKMRILSCSTGVKDLSMVVGGLQVQLNPEWIMKKPLLKPLTDKMPFWIETPIRPGSGRNTQYQGEVFFPIIYFRDIADMHNLEFGMQGDFPVCQKDKCMTFPIRMGLNLSPNEADYTSVCAYVVDQQLQNPLVAEIQGVEGKAWVENDTLMMHFSGIRMPTIAFLQTLGQDEFQVQETRLEEEGVVMRVKAEAWEVGQKKEWILVTNKGIFRVPVTMQTHSVSLPSPKPPLSIWWLGWELFFFTPLFLWCGTGIARTKKLWQKKILHFCLLLPVVFIGHLFLSKYIPLDETIYGIVLLSLICLFPPQKKSSALILFLIWPFFPKTPEVPPLTLGLWVLIMFIEMLIPFVFLYLKASEIGKIFRELKKKHFFTYNLIFLLPTVYLLGMSCWRLYRSDISFQNELNKNGLSIVTEKRSTSEWKKFSDASLIASDSILGQNLQKIYERNTPLIIWQDDWGRVILSPNSSPSNVVEFMSNWRNYHALYTP